MDEITSLLSSNLKLIRKKNNYSLDDVAQLTGVSKSMLRQIEMGESSPSISTVWKIANGLKTSFTGLLAKRQDSVSTLGFRDSAPLLENGASYRLFPLFPYDDDRKFEVYYIEMDPGAMLESEGHAGEVEEYVFVLSGRMTIRAGEGSHEVKQEGAIRFSASGEHGYANRAEGIARALMIIYYGSIR